MIDDYAVKLYFLRAAYDFVINVCDTKNKDYIQTEEFLKNPANDVLPHVRTETIN